MKIIFKLLIFFIVITLSQKIYSQNKSLYLKDTSSYGIIPHSSSFSSIAVNNKLTIECWINPGLVTGGIIGKEGCWSIEHIQNGIQLRLNSPVPQNLTVPIAYYSWQHLALTFDGDLNECKVYINGILKGTRTVSQNIQDVSSDVYLGRRYLISGTYLTNITLLDDVRIWNLVRTPQEISNSFQTSLSGGQIGLVANYKFDNVSSNIITDSSPNQNNGTLNGIFEITDDVFKPGIYTSVSWVEKTKIITTGSFKHNVISCPNNSTVWILNGNKISKTIDGGDTWISYNLPDTISGSAYYYVLTATDENKCLVSASTSTSTKVWKTVNGGTSWTEVFYESPGFINSIKMLNENTGYMMGDPVGGRWSLWKTTNGGFSWDSTGLYLLQQAGEYSKAVSMTCAQGIGWIFYSTRNGFYKSTDFVNFSYQSFSNGTYGNDILFINNNTVLSYTYSLTERILKSVNGGLSWYSSSGIPVYRGNMLAFGMLVKINNEIYSERGGNIIKSTNNGESFSPEFCPGTGNLSIMIKSQKTENNIIAIYAVSDYGNVYKADFQTIGVNNISTNVPGRFSLSQNYPNPFNPATKIKFEIKEPGLVKLKVFDMLGKEVAALVNERLAPGGYETDFDGSRLTSGVYFYKLEAENFSEVKRMMLVK